MCDYVDHHITSQLLFIYFSIFFLLFDGLVLQATYDCMNKPSEMVGKIIIWSHPCHKCICGYEACGSVRVLKGKLEFRKRFSKTIFERRHLDFIC